MAKVINRTTSSTTSIKGGKVSSSVTEVSSVSSSYTSGRGIRAFFVILLGVIFIILFINLMRYGNSSGQVNFSGFLNYISNAPNLRINFSINTFQISGTWVVFDELRQFINVLGSIVGLALYSVTSIINCLSYIFYFLRYVFV